MLAGANALNCLPSSTVASAAGVADAAGAAVCDEGEQLADTNAPMRTNAAIRRMAAYLESAVPSRAGRSVSTRPSARVNDLKMPAGSPLRTGFTTTVTLSPGLMMFDFQPARTR